MHIVAHVPSQIIRPHLFICGMLPGGGRSAHLTWPGDQSTPVRRSLRAMRSPRLYRCISFPFCSNRDECRRTSPEICINRKWCLYAALHAMRPSPPSYNVDFIPKGTHKPISSGFDSSRLALMAHGPCCDTAYATRTPLWWHTAASRRLKPISNKMTSAGIPYKGLFEEKCETARLSSNLVPWRSTRIQTLLCHA